MIEILIQKKDIPKKMSFAISFLDVDKQFKKNHIKKRSKRYLQIEEIQPIRTLICVTIENFEKLIQQKKDFYVATKDCDNILGKQNNYSSVVLKDFIYIYENKSYISIKDLITMF